MEQAVCNALTAFTLLTWSIHLLAPCPAAALQMYKNALTTLPLGAAKVRPELLHVGFSQEPATLPLLPPVVTSCCSQHQREGCRATRRPCQACCNPDASSTPLFR